MATRQTLVVVSVVVVAALAAVGPAVGAVSFAADGELGADDATADGLAQTTADGTNETDGAANETQFGTQMAAFMQSNAAQVNDSVEDGMWEAAFERANESERARMASNRAESLEGRLNALEAQNHSLYQRYRNGSISYEAYVVRASQLNGRLEALEDGVGGTALAAERTGVNVSALEELRTKASNLTGPEVAGVARGLVDGDTGPPEGVPGRGPPDDADDGDDGPDPGPPSDAGDGNPDGNATEDGESTTEAPGNAPGNPANGSDDPGNAPEDPGNGSGDAPGSGSGAESGSGSGAESGNGSGAESGNGNSPNPGNGNGNNPGSGADPGSGDDAGADGDTDERAADESEEDG